jgi:hypothetical protein
VRLATEDEIETWRSDGWVVLEGLIGTDEIDAAVEDLRQVFPTAEEFHADPEGVTDAWIGRRPTRNPGYIWPADGPGFRPEQHIWQGDFPFPGSGALNRLVSHPSIVDFVTRALETPDIRLYQAGVNAKYTGVINYEQPMHTDRNHSLLPPKPSVPWLHVESFLFLSDVDEAHAPTHLVPLPQSVGREVSAPLYMPPQDPELYAAERAATGPRGSLLVYRPDVFHRGTDITAPGGARFLLNVSFQDARQEWVAYDGFPSHANSPDWVKYAEGSTPGELALFGFPAPGHEIWDAAMIDATAARYPNLDMTPWRAALRG